MNKLVFEGNPEKSSSVFKAVKNEKQQDQFSENSQSTFHSGHLLAEKIGILYYDELKYDFFYRVQDILEDTDKQEEKEKYFGNNDLDSEKSDHLDNELNKKKLECLTSIRELEIFHDQNDFVCNNKYSDISEYLRNYNYEINSFGFLEK